MEKYTYPDGSKYVGEMKNGKRHGRGIWVRTDGMKYEGEWENDKPGGQGTLTSPDGKKRAGKWEKGKFVGGGQQVKPETERENQNLKEENKNLKRELAYLRDQQPEESFFSDKTQGKKLTRQEIDHPFIGNASNPERVSRLVILLAFLRVIILIPQFIVIGLWGFLAMIVLFIMWIVAIFTARYPEGMYNFVLGYYQKIIQVLLYENCLTHKYPPFSLSGKEFKE